MRRRDAVRHDLRCIRHALVSAPHIVRSADTLHDPFNVGGNSLPDGVAPHTPAPSSPVKAHGATPAAKRFRMMATDAFGGGSKRRHVGDGSSSGGIRLSDFTVPSSLGIEPQDPLSF